MDNVYVLVIITKKEKRQSLVLQFGDFCRLVEEDELDLFDPGQSASHMTINLMAHGVMARLYPYEHYRNVVYEMNEKDDEYQTSDEGMYGRHFRARRGWPFFNFVNFKPSRLQIYRFYFIDIDGWASESRN